MAMTMPPPRFSTPSNFMLDLRSGPSSAISAGPSNPAQLFQPYYLRPAYRFKSNIPRDDANNEGGPGRRLRKNVANVRRHIDYVATVLNHVENRLWQYSPRDRLAIQPDSLYQNSVLPPASTSDTPVDCILTRFVRAAMNKVKCPIYSICWTPEGKRLITGASTGEFTLWNGTAFNFETILQAHDTAIRALRWSHNDQWLVSADHDGFVKYWQPNMNNVHMYQAHKNEAIRCISFSPTDIKLATASDDGTARVWDFARCVEERILRGHGSDVRTVDWHPQKGLLVTGSRDSQQPVKLWDPKTGSCLATLHDHKNSVMAVQWNMNGNWLITGSRDHLIKLYDIRMMREVRTFRGHKKEVTSLAWHPIHEGLFVSGGGDGSLAYWLVNNEKEVGLLEHAHDQAVWTLEWHPLGSNDNNTKFWSRNKPGDTQEDIFGLASFSNPSVSSGILSSSTTAGNAATDKDATATIVNTYKDDGGGESRNGGGAAAPIIPGMGLDADIYQDMKRDIVSGMSIIPGLGGGPLLYPEDLNSRHGINQQHQHHQQTTMMNSGAKRTLIKQPPPKRVQRQFERMWNVAKPSGGGMDDDEHHHQDYGITDSDPFHRSRTSLLGHHPPSSPPSSQQQPPPMNIMIDQQQAPSSMGTNPFDLSPSSSMQQQQHLPPMHMQQWPPMPPPPMIGQQQQQQQPYLVPPPMLGPMWVQPPQLSHSHLDFDMDYRAAAAAVDNPTPMPLSTVGALAPPSAIKTANEVIADSDRSAVGQSWRTTSITDHDLRLMQQQALLAAAGPSSTPQQPLYSADNATIQSTNNSRDPRQQQQQQRNNRPGGGDFFGNNPTSTTVDINEPYNANQVPLGSGIGSETMIGGGGGGMRDPRRRNNRDYPTKRK